MEQLRIIARRDVTDDVVAVLEDSPGVTGLAVLKGAAIKPEGDVVMCDIARESVSEIVDQLREMGIDDDGIIDISPIRASLEKASDEAEKAAPGEPGDAVVWAAIEQQTGQDGRVSVNFIVTFVVAMIIAAVGVATDSAILIVGSMVVGPDYGPVAAICVGIVRRRGRFIARGIIALVCGFVAGGIGVALLALAMHPLGLLTPEMLSGPRPNTSFIWRPDALSWVIAAVAGIAGMLSLTSDRSGALVGVLISVTTVPAAADASLGAVFGHWTDCFGSLTQLGINVVALLVAGSVTLAVQRLMFSREKGEHPTRFQRMVERQARAREAGHG